MKTTTLAVLLSLAASTAAWAQNTDGWEDWYEMDAPTGATGEPDIQWRARQPAAKPGTPDDPGAPRGNLRSNDMGKHAPLHGPTSRSGPACDTADGRCD